MPFLLVLEALCHLCIESSSSCSPGAAEFHVHHAERQQRDCSQDVAGCHDRALQKEHLVTHRSFPMRDRHTHVLSIVCFGDRISLYKLWLITDNKTHCLEQADLELRDLPASASQVLGLKACSTAQLFSFVMITELIDKCDFLSLF